MTTQKDQEKNQACEVPPCIRTLETGKHEWQTLESNHRAGYKFWVKSCPSCGWVDTEDIINQLSQKIVPEKLEDDNNPDTRQFGWNLCRSAILKNINSLIK